MDERMKYLEKIDFVLNHIKQNKDTTTTWLLVLYSKEYPHSGAEFEYITRKLIKDELILLYPSIQAYNITFEGLIFEGYVTREKNKQLTLQSQEVSLAKAASDSERLATGTTYLWIGTAALVLVELLKLWIEHHPSCH